MGENQSTESSRIEYTPYFDLAEPLYDVPTKHVVDETVDRIVAFAKVEALETAADLLRDLRETFDEQHRSGIVAGETAVRLLARSIRDFSPTHPATPPEGAGS